MHNHRILFVLAACGALSCQRPSQTQTPLPAGYTLDRKGDVHDFDFFVGTWKSTQHRLKVRNVGSKEWDDFPGDLVNRQQLGGITNTDETVFPTKGWAGLALRTFDVAKRQWAIYWVSSKRGGLDTGVFGGFDGDHGEFYGEDTDDGHPIRVRFLWTKLGPGKAPWEQAFSYDGRSWETNWTIDWERVRG
jgi:hypothetical protein